jgi:hypothetical protein
VHHIIAWVPQLGQCSLLSTRRLLRLLRHFWQLSILRSSLTLPALQQFATLCKSSSSFVTYLDAALAKTMPGKRPDIDILGDADELVKRPRLSGSARSILFNEAIVSQPSTDLIDLTGDDCKPQFLGLVGVTDKEPKSSRDARNNGSNWATPSQSSVQIVSLSNDDIDLDKLPPRTAPSHDPTEKCDKPHREKLTVYNPTSIRDNSRFERMAYDPVEESSKLQPISIAECDVANKSKP